MSAAKPLLEARGLEAGYGASQVLFGVELDIPAGRVTTLLGRNGMGKSTLLKVLTGTLPHGAQRALDVALALAAQPKLLLLDEPMAGMGPDESARMVTLIASLRSEMAILLIEHDMDAVFRLADRITVLVQGKLLMTGSADEVRGHPDVQAVYLGTEAEGHS